MIQVHILVVAMVCVTSASAKMNVLFMMSDDLRPEISALKEPGDSMYPRMKTPNIDQLAAESFVLK